MTLANLRKMVIVVGIHEKEYTPKGESEKKVLFNLGICNETGETGMIRCTDDVARIVKEEKFKRFTEHEIVCSYNDQYNRFICEGIV